MLGVSLPFAMLNLGVWRTSSFHLDHTILDMEGLINEPLVRHLGAKGGQRVHCAIHKHQGINLAATYAAHIHQL